jgi:glycosyltransferase involved in cell wall biosynthesis
MAMIQPPVGRGGVQTHVAAVRQLFADRQIDVDVVHPTSRARAISWPILAVTRAIRRSNADPAVTLDREAHRFSLQAAIPARLEGCDVVYAQDPRSAHAALEAARARIPVVMAVHYNGSQADELVERGQLRAGGRAERRIREFEAGVLSRLDGLVYVSNFMRRRVERDVPAAANVHSAVIPNFLPPLPRSPDQFGANGNLRDCVTVGYLNPRKNQRYLLRVLAAAQRWSRTITLTIVGDGPQRAELESLAARLGVAGQVAFAGVRDDVDAVLRRHRVYTHSSSLENCPFAIIEAMRQGLPVFAARAGGLPEMIGDGQAGAYWDLTDPDQGAAALLRLLDSPDELARARSAALARFHERFSEDVAGDALLAFLADVARQRSP